MAAFPVLTEEFKMRIAELAAGEVIASDDIRLVIQKRLDWSELTPALNCFMILPNQMQINDFLNEGEIEMKVRVIFPSMEVATLTFKRWVTEEVEGIEPRMFYLLTGRYWYIMTLENEFHRGMEVQLWTFRINKELCFALVLLWSSIGKLATCACIRKSSNFTASLPTKFCVRMLPTTLTS